MYSKFNVDVSCKNAEFDTVRIFFPPPLNFINIYYKVLPIIRGSSTVNGDSAHDHTALGMEHNYVTFNVKKIKLSCSFLTNINIGSLKRPSYVVLFKVPYIDENNLPKPNSIQNFILYKNPECVLSYDCLNLLNTRRNHTDITLYCNKTINVGPTDYVGVCYFLIEKYGNITIDVDASAEVTFKPI